MGGKWRDYVKGLAKQQPPLLVESLAPVTPAIIKGEAQVGIAYIKFVKQYKGLSHMFRSTNISPIPIIWHWGPKRHAQTPAGFTSNTRCPGRGRE